MAAYRRSTFTVELSRCDCARWIRSHEDSSLDGSHHRVSREHAEYTLRKTSCGTESSVQGESARSVRTVAAAPCAYSVPLSRRCVPRACGQPNTRAWKFVREWLDVRLGLDA